jgi:hypothetical protein
MEDRCALELMLNLCEKRRGSGHVQQLPMGLPLPPKALINGTQRLA